MGWNYRKSTKIGPFRITASKKGVGWSVGSKYLRYGKSATGRSYISSGSNGLYYRKNLSSSNPSPVHNRSIQSHDATQVSPIVVVCLCLFVLSPIAGLIFGSWSVFLWMAAIAIVVFFVAAIMQSFDNYYSKDATKVTTKSVPLANENPLEDEIDKIDTTVETLSIEEKITNLNLKGSKYEENEYIELAIRCFEESIKLGCKEELPYTHLIGIYRKLGKMPEVKRIAIIGTNVFPAKIYYRRVLEKNN